MFIMHLRQVISGRAYGAVSLVDTGSDARRGTLALDTVRPGAQPAGSRLIYITRSQRQGHVNLTLPVPTRIRYLIRFSSYKGHGVPCPFLADTPCLIADDEHQFSSGACR